jgi:hypothetical protein
MYVKGEAIISFLEQQLTQFGLTSKEQADFITFWGPQLMKNKLNYVHFVLDEAANQFGILEIQPKPTTVSRIYIVWSDVSNVQNLPQLTEQKITKRPRKGFHVIEWGGFMLTQTQFTHRII